MRLKRLELQGFKSFADKTTFEFDSGVTAFVGPNGCGKSNIVDAVRWILGEQSAKAVRGNQMVDVIFNGTARRRSLGFAEASLTVENNDGRMASEYTEVCITRRLYRSGESEYLINRQPCRLRDIRQLFMDTGVGIHTYSIIEQGKVDRFIQANASERRLLLEEAAGISRYKAQRKETQSRLERAHQNLQKVDIKLEEQRKQLRSIKYQAAKARRYQRYAERLRRLEVSLSARNYKQWSEELVSLEESIGALHGRDGVLAADLEAFELQLEAAETQIGRIETANFERREELHRVNSRIDTAKASIEHNRQRISEYQEETEQCNQTVWALNEKLRQTRDALAGNVRNLANIREAIERQTGAIAEAGRKADVAGAECARIAAAIEEWKNSTLEVLERATALRNDLSLMDHSRREQLNRRARLAGQLAEKRQEEERIDKEIAHLTGRRDEISGRLADRGSLLQERQQELQKLEESAIALDEKLRELHHREAQCLSRREILQDIEMRSEDVENGVKRLLLKEGEEEAGLHILGMVADLVRSDLKYAAAIEVALGAAAQHLVTRSEKEAGAAAALLRRDRAGRAGLIPLCRVRGPEHDGLHLRHEAGVVGRASDLVRYEPHLEPIVRHLLGHTWVVQDLATALRLACNGSPKTRFVTLDGERVDASGSIVGGEPLPRIGIVSRKSELDSIEANLQSMGEEGRHLEAERGRITQQAESLRADVEGLRKEIENGSIEKLSNENEILNLRRRQKVLLDESALLNSEIAEIDEAVRGYEDRRKAIEIQLDETNHRREALQREIAAALTALEEQQAAAAQVREEVARLKDALSDKKARLGGLEQGIKAAKTSMADIDSQIVAARRRMNEIREKQTQAEAAMAAAMQQMEGLKEKRQALQEEVRRLAEALEQAQAKRTECAEKMRIVRARQEEVRGELHNRQIEEQKLRVRMEGLSEHVFDEHGIRLEEYDDDPVALILEAAMLAGGNAAAETTPDNAVAEPNWDAVKQKIDELREKVRRLGGVNVESIDEADALEIAIAETEAHREDLIQAEAHLREVIRKLNRVCRDRFVKTFETVRQNFHDTFRRLFGGGKADLVLDEEEPDILEAGIDVLACPPGKEMRSITLLSGGEKTMTTIALIFAIFKAKPAPFCILDEVDAALDEVNIDRFSGMLVEFLKDSQFIVITHSKRTIGIADMMYGITMQEKGVSKQVAVNLEGTTVTNN